MNANLWAGIGLGLMLGLSGCTAEHDAAVFRGSNDAGKHDDGGHEDTGVHEDTGKHEDTGVHEDTGKHEDTGDVPRGCTLTMGYWRNHNAEARNPNQRIDWPIPEDTLLCDETWLNWLRTPPRGDAWIILARQWIVVQLNAAAGAFVPPHIEEAMDQATTLLADCSIADDDRSQATALADLLDAYNNGNEGVPHCDDANN